MSLWLIGAKISMASDFFLAAFKVPRQENHTHNILGEEKNINEDYYIMLMLT